MADGRIRCALRLLVPMPLILLALSCAAPAPAPPTSAPAAPAAAMAPTAARPTEAGKPVQVRTVVAEKKVVVITTPTPRLATPAPEVGAAASSPSPTATCIDDMARVRDLNLDDRAMAAPPEVAPGQRFVKGWKVRNAGTCIWDESYALAFVQGDSPLADMGGSAVSMDASVPAGAEHDIYVELIAPQAPGVYQAFWQLRNGRRVPFGERVRVAVRVPAPPTPTPLPTATPLPTGTFMADRTRLAAGECVTLTWRFEEIREIHFAIKGRPDTVRGVMGQDSRQECPQESTVYELRVTHFDDSLEVRRIPVAVAGGPSESASVRFTIEPEPEMRAGECVQLSWEVKGGDEFLCIFRDDVQIGEGAPLAGRIRDCPPGSGDVTYVLQANCPDGVVYARREVKVLP